MLHQVTEKGEEKLAQFRLENWRQIKQEAKLITW